MSAVKQIVAAILMDYTDKIPEQDYIDILNRLGKIPDHKDPKKATEIQKELDEANRSLSMLEDERDLLIEEVHNEKELRKEWQMVGRSLAFLCEKIFNKKPTVEGTKVIYDISTMDEVDRNIDKVNGFLNNLEEWKKDKTIKIDESYIYNSTNEENVNRNLEPLPDDFREQLRDLLDDRRNSLYISEDDELEYSDSDDESYIECDNDDEKSECDDKYEDDFLTIPQIDDTKIRNSHEISICGFPIQYLISEINYVFNGKVHNYYGAILLHENNCWHKQLESVTKFKIHHTKKNKMREMKFQIFQNKKSEWNQIQKIGLKWESVF